MANERVFTEGGSEFNSELLWQTAAAIDPEGAGQFDLQDPIVKAGIQIASAVIYQESLTFAVVDDEGHYGEAKITPMGERRFGACHAAVEIRSNNPGYIAGLNEIMQNMPPDLGQVFITTEETC